MTTEPEGFAAEDAYIAALEDASGMPELLAARFGPRQADWKATAEYWQSEASRLHGTAEYWRLRHEAVDYEEWSAFIWEQDRWRPVGVSGSRETANAEMNDWHQEVPDARLALGSRHVGPWKVPADD